MGTDNNQRESPPTETTDLSQSAQKELKANAPEASSTRTESETQMLLQESEVHQVELEIQNAEFLKT
jgi:hypothetical protein